MLISHSSTALARWICASFKLGPTSYQSEKFSPAGTTSQGLRSSGEEDASSLNQQPLKISPSHSMYVFLHLPDDMITSPWTLRLCLLPIHASFIQACDLTGIFPHVVHGIHPLRALAKKDRHGRPESFPQDQEFRAAIFVRVFQRNVRSAPLCRPLRRSATVRHHRPEIDEFLHPELEAAKRRRANMPRNARHQSKDHRFSRSVVVQGAVLGVEIVGHFRGFPVLTMALHKQHHTITHLRQVLLHRPLGHPDPVRRRIQFDFVSGQFAVRIGAWVWFAWFDSRCSFLPLVLATGF